MFFLTLCEEPTILNLILFIKSILEIGGIIVPIILIVMVTVDLIKIILDASEKTIKDSSKSMLNRIIAAIMVFFVPVVVNVLMNMIEQDNVEKTACWTNANTETIAKFKAVKEAKRLSEQEEKQKKIAENNKKREEEDKKRKENVVRRPDSDYGNNSSSSGIGSTDLLQTAMNQVGQGYKTFTDWYDFADEWCAIFVTWATAHTSITGNANDCKNTPRSGSSKCLFNSKTSADGGAVCSHAEWYASHNRFYHSEYYAKVYKTYMDGNKAYVPKPGDIIFIANGDSRYAGNPKAACYQFGHIAIVKEVKDGQVYYVGGNQERSPYTISEVSVNYKPIDSSAIGGYGTWGSE